MSLFERKATTASMHGATLCEQIDLRTPGRPEIPNTEEEKADNHIFYVQLDNTCFLISKHITADCRLRRQEASDTILCHIMNKTATWSEMKIHRSTIVCNAGIAQDTRHLAKHFAAVLQGIT